MKIEQNINDYNFSSYLNTYDDYPNPIQSTALISNNQPNTEEQFNKQDSFEIKYLGDSIKLYRAGPDFKIPFDPQKTKACIVTCGGLCPGLNVVIRELFYSLKIRYKINEIYGIKYGFKGFQKYPPKFLTETEVFNLKYLTGSQLGTSRGGFDLEKIMEKIIFQDFDLVFIIGGDGTMKGAYAIAQEFKKLKLQKSVIHIPKTIDNDIPLISQTFGFETAVGIAAKLLNNYKGLLSSYYNAVGFVKLMGRECGFIATKAAFLSKVVNILLIPEEDWQIDGNMGVINHIFRCLQDQGNCLICISEGACRSVRDYYPPNLSKDQSGNLAFFDIVKVIHDKFVETCKSKQMIVNVFSMDPSYVVRSEDVNEFDRDYCSNLAIAAAHCGMSGYNGITIGINEGNQVKIPLDLIMKQKVRKLNTKDTLYVNTILLSKQPKFINPNQDCNIKKVMYGNNISSGMLGMDSTKSFDNNQDVSEEKEKESKESSNKKLDRDSGITNSQQKNRLIENKNLHSEVKNDIDKQYSNYQSNKLKSIDRSNEESFNLLVDKKFNNDGKQVNIKQ